jgi:hypothetical protein
MGKYNPYQPYILGEEWVPIREASYSYSQDANSFERGTKFTLDTLTTLSEGRFYTDELNPNFFRNQIMNISVYPYGTAAADAGPIRRVVIPCNAGSIANLGSPNSVWGALLQSTTVPEAVANPGADKGVIIAYNVLTGEVTQLTRTVTMNFAVNQYAQALKGKRIIGVNWLYNLTISPADGLTFLQPIPVSFMPMSLEGSGGTTILNWQDPVRGTTFAGDASLSRMRIGDQAVYYTNTVYPYTIETMPWRYEELQRFEATNANPTNMVLKITSQFFTSIGSAVSVFLAYSALEVLYCEETRLATGSRVYNNSQLSSVLASNPTGGRELPYALGANAITLRDPQTWLANPLLSAGDYLVTLSQGNWGDVRTTDTSGHPEPTVNAIHQYYEIPTHRGLQINIPTPTTDKIVDLTLTEESTQILPQISLHSTDGARVTFSGVVNEAHVYGSQSVGQVWGTKTVAQRIADNMGVSRSYPNIRFWARRFGDTTLPLTVTSGASNTSIAAADFDSLDDIIDGWKQVDLRFPQAHIPAMGLSTYPTFTWSATGELAGNRWEVLGASAQALSGIVGNNWNLASVQLGSATYGAPVSGSGVFETWMPQYAPIISGAAADSTSDVAVMFSVDMDVVGSFSLSNTSQSLTGIGQDCGVDPWFIPHTLSYNRISWSTSSGTSVPLSGFGYYELQRMDTLTDWQTIALVTSPTVSSFNDFEARVGILTSYRMRAVNNYLFAGPWGTTITFTTPVPGITGLGMNSSNAHVLLFTSNMFQNGARNLAYSMAWQGGGAVTENFTFPEASWNVLQPMFQRDFFTAVRPTERGGVQFERTILVQAAAISTPTVPDFTSLRDLAWDQLPYVCLRDQDGNRWFANITVPSGQVSLNRSLYIATIQVAEVTDTAAQVEVSS